MVRNNVLDLLRPPVPGTIADNIFMRETSGDVRGEPFAIVPDPGKLFRDPEHGDYRRRPGGPMMDAGADVPPPPPEWSR